MSARDRFRRPRDQIRNNPGDFRSDLGVYWECLLRRAIADRFRSGQAQGTTAGQVENGSAIQSAADRNPIALASFPNGATDGFLEVEMRQHKRYGAVGLFLGALMLLGMGSLLSACGTVAGAGQDVSAIGNTVTGGANQTQRATGAP